MFSHVCVCRGEPRRQISVCSACTSSKCWLRPRAPVAGNASCKRAALNVTSLIDASRVISSRHGVVSWSTTAATAERCPSSTAAAAGERCRSPAAAAGRDIDSRWRDAWWVPQTDRADARTLRARAARAAGTGAATLVARRHRTTAPGFAAKTSHRCSMNEAGTCLISKKKASTMVGAAIVEHRGGYAPTLEFITAKPRTTVAHQLMSR